MKLALLKLIKLIGLIVHTLSLIQKWNLVFKDLPHLLDFEHDLLRLVLEINLVIADQFHCFAFHGLEPFLTK